MLAVFVGMATALLIASIGSSAAGDTLRVSLPNGPGEVNQDSFDPSISANGRYVAFTSLGTNLTAGDTHGLRQVYVRDTVANSTIAVSVTNAGAFGTGDSVEPAISADGTIVTFSSRASNLVSGDTNGASDIFVRDLTSNTTTRVSIADDGSQGDFNSFAPSISTTGRYIAFWSNANNLVPGDAPFTSDVFVYDRQTSHIELESVSSSGAPANVGGDSHLATISGDGRYVAFQSLATNLVPGDTNASRDVFVRDRTANTTTRVSVATGGAESNGESRNPVISTDGRYVVYESAATNLVTGDTNGAWDVFVTSVQSLATERESVSSTGTEGNADSSNATVNADGSFVAFESMASNLFNGDANDVKDIFVHNRTTAKTSLESLTNSGLETTAASFHPSLTGDGKLVAFHSYATNLVSGDTNNRADVFVHELGVADHQPPVVTGTPDRPANADGWYKANVTITWTSVDPPPSSGPPTQPPATVAAIEGRSLVYTSAPSCDLNQNCATGSLSLSIDKTPPTITASVPPVNANGWYRQPVVVGFSCADALSGIISCAAPVTLSADGTGQSATGTTQDRAGNVATTTVSGIKIDQTPPTITFSGNRGTYTSTQTIVITCSASDATSGIDTQVCPSLNSPASLLLPGPHTLTATATDKAGNTTTASTTFTIVSDRLVPIAQIACGYLPSSHGTGNDSSSNNNNNNNTTTTNNNNNNNNNNEDQRGGNDGHQNGNDNLCDKLLKIAQKADSAAAAGDSNKAYQGLAEFIKTVQDASGKSFTRQQAALLTALAAFVTY